MPGINIDALKDAIKKGKKVVYQSQNSNRDSVPFFNLWKEESWNASKQQYEAFIRLVQKPGTAGFALRVMHNKVGYPGNDPKSFTCPKFLDPKAECVLCDVVEMAAKDPDFKNAFIDWPEKKDGIPVIKPKSVADIIQSIAPEQRLIFVVAEPKFMGDPNANPQLRGLQVWFVQKRTLIKKITDILNNFPDDHFTDPQNGTALMVTFSPKNPPLEMYNVMPYRVMPIDPSVAQSAPDAEMFTSKLRDESEMKAKLAEMLPGVEI